jgi:DNA-binding CsgD family transcriptional regulator
MATTGISHLSDGQKQCLRLVHEGYEAKEIARKLLISHHTVVERLRTARRVLSAQTSREAARMLAVTEVARAQNLAVDSYTPHVGRHTGAVHTPIGIERKDDLHSLEAATSAARGSADHELQNYSFPKDDAAFASPSRGSIRRFPLPFPTAGRQKNDLNFFETISMIILLTLSLASAGLVAMAIVNELAKFRFN